MKLVATEWELEENRDIRVILNKHRYSGKVYYTAGYYPAYGETEDVCLLVNKDNPSWRGCYAHGAPEAEFDTLEEVYEAIYKAGIKIKT